MFNDINEISLVVETSWEVCNKVGGIYTVLSTKAGVMKKIFKDRVIFVGPDVWTQDNPSPWFDESKTVLKKWRESVELPEGVSVRVGRWNVPGKPIAVLVKFDGMYAVKDSFYGEMWQRYGVDSLHAYGDYDEACAFSHAAGIVTESLMRYHGADKGPAIAHFDEWTTAMGLLYIKSMLPRVSTVFTTHATCIGRSICGNGKPLYDYMAGYNGDQMAGELNMASKHSLEKAAAREADCFTTVSEITADECAQLLERRPDPVTPNGFEKDFVPGPRAIKKVRQAARATLLGVANALTGAEYDDDTFVVITSGRCEYRNKGLDMFLDSMNRLAGADVKRRVLAYVMVPAWVKEPRADLAAALSHGQTSRLPQPVITHDINNPYDDAVMCHMRGLGVTNLPTDRVSVIYVPCYLNGTDGIFNKAYYDLLPGADLTVFASYYEPWGYTPLESVAFGVPTITTTLAGFGRWVLSAFGDDKLDECGVKVVSRTDSNYDSATADIARTVCELANAEPKRLSDLSASARRTADAASWENFFAQYESAYKTAIANNTKNRKR
jgi:glycosyltransferase involved in cell wall biosynthesis